MFDAKYFLDLEGLSSYDKLIKDYIKTGSTDEIERIVGDLASLSTDLQTAQDAIDVLNGDASVAGSVAAQVQTAVADLVDGAPETFDTLKEIADWIANDETGTTALINRVSDLEDADVELKAYLEAEDRKLYNSIQSIDELKIAALFPVKQTGSQTAVQAIENVAEGKAVQLTANQEIAENLVIDKSCYIDANGSTFTGTVTIPEGVDVIIENATFSNPVVVA